MRNEGLAGILKAKREAILERWFQVVVETYPPETSRFMRAKNNRFANPVGHSFQQGLKGILDCLISGEGEAETAPFIDEIVRIRAVQEFSPSQAVTVLHSLKEILRDEGKGPSGEIAAEDLLEIHNRVDRLVLQAFDIYMSCRETLFDIRVKELKEKAAVEAGLRLKKAAGSTVAKRERGQTGGPEMKRGEEI